MDEFRCQRRWRRWTLDEPLAAMAPAERVRRQDKKLLPTGIFGAENDLTRSCVNLTAGVGRPNGAVCGELEALTPILRARAPSAGLPPPMLPQPADTARAERGAGDRVGTVDEAELGDAVCHPQRLPRRWSCCAG